MKILSFLILLFPICLFAQADSISTILQRHIQHSGKQKVHNILLYLEDSEADFVFHGGFGLTEKKGVKVVKDAQFKAASITKSFVATIVLQLEEEGKLKLSDKAFQYLQNVDFLDFEHFHYYKQKPYATQITIEQLLSHRSGLADIFNDKGSRFYLGVMLNKQKQYTPKSIVQKYHRFRLNQHAHFKPGDDFFYSDMNYVLLGLVIQELEQMPLAEVIRKRILEPLNLKNTYLEFYEPSQNHQQRVHQYLKKIDMTKVNTSFDWAGGGLVSTTEELAVFIKALFSGQLISQKSLKKMTSMRFTKEHQNPYGLGMYESTYNKDTYYGHYGFYGSYVGYCPQKKIVIAYNISQASPNFYVTEVINQILKTIHQNASKNL